MFKLGKVEIIVWMTDIQYVDVKKCVQGSKRHVMQKNCGIYGK